MSLPALTGCLSAQAGGEIIYAGDWVEGKVGNYALEFGGTDEYVSISGPTDLEMSSGTIAGWIKRADLTTKASLFSLGQAGDAGNAKQNYALEVDANNSDDKLYLNIGNGTYYAYAKSTTTITDTDWHHIAASFSNSGRDLVLYIDGAAETLSVSGTNAGAGGFTPAIFGSQEANLGVSVRTTIYARFLTGTLDEVAVWDTVLSAGNIAALAGVSSDPVTADTISSSDLLIYYNFEGGPGNSTVVDRTGNGRTGTMNNMEPG